jgi:hypothetical protein
VGQPTVGRGLSSVKPVSFTPPVPPVVHLRAAAITGQTVGSIQAPGAQPVPPQVTLVPPAQPNLWDAVDSLMKNTVTLPPLNQQAAPTAKGSGDLYFVSFYRKGDPANGGELVGVFTNEADAKKAADKIRKWAATIKDPDWKIVKVEIDKMGSGAKGATSIVAAKSGDGNKGSVPDFAGAATAQRITAIAQRNWTKSATKAAQNLANDKDLSAELRRVANNVKLFSADDLRAMVSIESSADRQTGKNKFGYAGLFQMGPSAAKEAGYDYKKLSQPSDWRTNIAAGVRYLEINAARLKKAGVEVTPLNLYMAHQQGATGAIKILRELQDGSASKTPANRNQLANLPASILKAVVQSGRKVTVQDYYDYWSAAFRTVSDRVNTTSPNVPINNTPLP